MCAVQGLQVIRLNEWLSVSTPQSYDHLLYGIIQCYLPPDTGKCDPTNPSQKGWYSIYLSWRDRRVSWHGWLVIYQNGLPTHRWSPIQVLTGPEVKQLRYQDQCVTA